MIFLNLLFIATTLLCLSLLIYILFPGGDGFKNPLHIPQVYFKRFLPVSNLVRTSYRHFTITQYKKKPLTLSSTSV